MSIEEIVLEIKKGNTGLKNELWERVYKWAVKLCLPYRERAERQNYELDDLINVSWFGIERAIHAYDPKKGFKFITYMRHNIRNTLSAFLGSKGKNLACGVSLDKPVDDESNTTLLDMLEDETAAQAFEDVERREIGDWIVRMVDTLEDGQKGIVKALYLEGKTAVQIAQEMGCSSSRINQIKSKAFRVLRQKPEMREYYQTFCYRTMGIKRFNTTWTSSTEWAAIKLEAIREKERIFMERYNALKGVRK